MLGKRGTKIKRGGRRKKEILLLRRRKERWKRSGPGRNKGNNRIREEGRGGKTKGTREGSVGGRRSTFARVGGRERKRRAAGRPTDRRGWTVTSG